MKPSTIEPLTSIRGIAALWVYLYHCQFLTTASPFFNELTKRGYWGVDIFFVLSGFIISYVHLQDFPALANIRERGWHFLKLRLARIYPLHLFTLLLIVLLQQLHMFKAPNERAVQDFIQNIFLVQSWGFSEKLSWNVVSWSISVEWLLYLSFPLLAWAVGTRAKDIFSNLLLLVLALSLWMWYFAASGTYLSYMHEPGLSIPRGVLDFTIGMALYNLFRLRFLEKLPWDALAMGTIAAFAMLLWIKSQKIIVHDIAVVLLSATLVYSLANVRGFACRLFSHPVLSHLGKISYSLYMLHWIYIALIWPHHDVLFDEKSFFTWQFAVMSLGLIGIASLSFHFIENPARKWVRTLV